MARKRRIVIKVAAGVVTVLLVAAVGAYIWLQYAPRAVPAGQPALEELQPGSLDAVKEAFNAGVGEVRVLALLSPT